MNGGPGSHSSSSKVASPEAATIPENEKPATKVLLPKEEEAKNLNVKDEELRNIVTIIEPKTSSVVVEVNVCRKSQ